MTLTRQNVAKGRRVCLLVSAHTVLSRIFRPPFRNECAPPRARRAVELEPRGAVCLAASTSQRAAACERAGRERDASPSLGGARRPELFADMGPAHQLCLDMFRRPMLMGWLLRRPNQHGASVIRRDLRRWHVATMRDEHEVDHCPEVAVAELDGPRRPRHCRHVKLQIGMQIQR